MAEPNVACPLNVIVRAFTTPPLTVDWFATSMPKRDAIAPKGTTFGSFAMIVPVFTIPPVTVDAFATSMPLVTTFEPAAIAFGPFAVMVPEFEIPPVIVAPDTAMPRAFPVPLTLIAFVLVIPAPIVLAATLIPKPPTADPGVIVPALTTAPVTVELMMMIEVVDCPTGFVTLGTVWFTIVCPARAGTATRSAAIEVEARSIGAQETTDAKSRREKAEKVGIEKLRLES